MRIRLTSVLLTHLAMAGAVVCTLPASTLAWDQDRVQSELQPYIGAWTGWYLVNRQDLNDLVSYNRTLPSDFFSAGLPVIGGSLGVAYGRVHVGLNAGYQMLNGDLLPKSMADGSMTSSFYYRYQVIPVDLNLDVALLPNKTPVNLLVGGSVGVGFVGMQLPFSQLVRRDDSTHITTTNYRNEWNWNNFILATTYVGARINLARRLNLEAQLGWRFLKSDEVELGRGARLERTVDSSYVIDSLGNHKLTNTASSPIPVDLSDPYIRADIRWTFASDQERDEERAADRVRLMREILAMTPGHAGSHQD